MDSKVSIIMYHYVRDSARPFSKGKRFLSTDLFRQQISNFMSNYHIITPELLVDSIKGNKRLPHKSLLLTFDDGYIDHYQNVLPILVANGIKACFFPSSMPLFENKLLDTNKIQLIRDYAKDKTMLHACILNQLKNLNITKYREIKDKLHTTADETGAEEMIFNILEYQLPFQLSSRILGRLFRQFVGSGEGEMAKDLYMNLSQLKELKAYGMHIGCHSYSHYYMTSLDQSKQREEIVKSLKMLDILNGSRSQWIMCYPYGAYNSSLIHEIKHRGCLAGFSTGGEIADLTRDDMFALPRLNIRKLVLKEEKTEGKI